MTGALRGATARLRSMASLTVLLVLGMSIAVAIPTALPIFADGATARALAQRDFASSDDRPPFAYMFSFNGGLSAPIDWDAAVPADRFLDDELDKLGLPLRARSTLISSSTVRLLAPGADAESQPLTNNGVAYAAMDHVEQLVHIDGLMPRPAVVDDPLGSVEVLMADTLAEQLQLGVGDELTAFDPGVGLDSRARTRRLVISAIWTPVDRTDARWVIDPSQFANRLIVHRRTLTDVLSPSRPDFIRSIRWYALLDAGALRTNAVDTVIARGEAVERDAAALLPGIVRDIDPITELRSYRAEATTLARDLRVYAIPSVGIVLIFLLLVVGVSVDRRRAEIALLRSRGATRRFVLGQCIVEAVMLSAAAVLIGVALAWLTARSMGRVDAFLRFDGRPLAVGLPSAAWRIAAAMGALTIALQVLPAIPAMKANRVTLAVETARASQTPWWQRTGLDLIVAALATVLTILTIRRQRSAPAVLGDSAIALLPTMIALTVGLLTLRVLPWALQRMADGAARLPGVVVVLAVRRAARSPRTTQVPLLLLIVTISSAVFTASLSRTMDTAVYDEEYAMVGADWVVQEVDAVVAPQMPGADPAGPPPRRLATMARYLAVPGVVAATRVARFDGSVERPADGVATVRFFGVDAQTFADTATYREPGVAGALAIPDAMRRLAGSADAVLADPALGVRPGDTLTVTLSIDNRSTTYRAVVAGLLGEFPTWSSASSAALVVGNLDFVHQLTGDPAWYSVWLRTANNESMIETELRSVAPQLSVRSPADGISRRLDSPSRQGVVSLLTIGFLASLAVSMLGLVLAAANSVRRSVVELGALQAMGMTPIGVATLLVAELAVVVLAGLAVGIATGRIMSRRLIADLLSGLPAEIDHSAVVLVGVPLLALFAVASGGLLIGLRRRRVFEALRLGVDT